MTNSDQQIADRLEAFLDGLSSREECAEMDRLFAADRSLSDQVVLQEQIDDSLQRMFTPSGSPSLPAEIEALLAEPPKVEPVAKITPVSRTEINPRRNSRQKAMLLALAASLAWLLVGAQVFRPSRQEVAYNPKPLTELYQQCVSEGFQPYWVCDDDDLFAATFETRQGVPLKLAGLPDGRRMVGLSYLSGLSRKSTSLLALVDSTPVIVFIDKIENDRKLETGNLDQANLTITRTERVGLVFYEVSPLDESLVAPFLVVAD